MQTNCRVYIRSAVAVTAGVALLSGGGSALAAQGVATDHKDIGNIIICKQVRGSDDEHQKFRFIIRERGAGKTADFLLRSGDCRTEPRLDVGTYRVRERDIPKNCDLVNIRVRGPFERINLKNGVAVVKVEKNRTTTVTFVDRCHKDKE